MLFSQWQPSHRQTPNGAAMLKSMATIVAQATHCRNESNSISSIISSAACEVNKYFLGKPKISEFRQFLGLQIFLSMLKWEKRVCGSGLVLRHESSPYNPSLWEEEGVTHRTERGKR